MLRGGVVGEQQDRSPIDIKYSSLVKRLEELGKLRSNWRQRLSTIHSSVTAAHKKLKQPVLDAIDPSGTCPIDYLLAKSIRDVLQEGATKTLFGGLTGEAGIWDKIVVAYGKQNVWMGEAAVQLQRSVEFELPHQKNTRLQAEQQVQSLQRRREECLKAAQASAARFKEECLTLGVRGKELRAEVALLRAELPNALQPFVDGIRGEVVLLGMRAYTNFTRAVHGDAAAGIQTSECLLPTLQQIIDRNVDFDAALAPMFELHSDEAEYEPQASSSLPVLSLDVDMPDLDLVSEDLAAAPDQGAGVAGISQIDWDASALEETEFAASAGTEQEEVNWNISIESGYEEADEEVPDDCADTQSAPGDVAITCSPNTLCQDKGVLRLAYDAAFRATTVAELHELRAFVVQLSSEASHECTATLQMPEDALVEKEDLQKIEDAIQATLSVLEQSRVLSLIGIVSSNAYKDRLVRALEMRGLQESKMQASAAEAARKQQDIQHQIANLVPKHKEHKAYLRRLSDTLTSSLASQLGRPVNLTGEITQWLT